MVINDKLNMTMNTITKNFRLSNLSLILASALAIVSCAKEISEVPTEPDNSTPEYTTITLTAAHPVMTETGAATQENKGTAAISTKTTLDETTGSVSWAAEDKLKLVCEDGTDFITDALTEADIKEDGTATFKATNVPAGKTLKWAVYPSEIVTSLTGGKFSVTVPQEQDGKFEHASIEVGEIGENNSIALKNVCALLKFTIANEGAAKVFIGGNGAPLNGKATISSEILAASYTASKDVPDYQPNVEVSVKNGPGTYYAAILPAKTTGLSMQIYSADNTLLAENISSNVLDAPRKAIKNLGELRSTPFANKRFVTENGTGDGSSWENAWSFSKLFSNLQTLKLTDHVIIMSEGIARSATSLITLAAGTKFKVYGGYSKTSSGTDITSRDLNKYKTNFAGMTQQKEGESVRLFNYTDGTIETFFDGVGFTETYQNAAEAYGGTCLIISNVQKAYFVNCRIENNKKDGSAVVRVGGTKASVTLERCTFSNNTVSGKGLIQVQKGGNLTVRDCDFKQGNTVSGEAPDGPYKDKYRVCYKTGGVFTFEGDNKFAADQYEMSGNY